MSKTKRVADVRTNDFTIAEIFCPYCGMINFILMQTKSYYNVGALITREIMGHDNRVVTMTGECRDCHGFICVTDEANSFVEIISDNIWEALGTEFDDKLEMIDVGLGFPLGGKKCQV